MTNSTRVITPASFPALLRGLITTRVLNITEPKEFEQFDTFLEIAGDRDTHFENPKLESRGHQTHNEYDISRLSVLLTFNTLNYYKDKQQENKFFDNVFRYHIQSRYIPFMFKGHLNHIERQDLNDETYNELLEWLRNFYYYGENWQKYLHNYGVDLSRLKWGIRYRESFEQIIKFLDFISKDEQDFYNMVDELIRCHIAYMRMIDGNSVTIYDSIMPKKAEPIKDFEHLQPEIIDLSKSNQRVLNHIEIGGNDGFSLADENAANSPLLPITLPQQQEKEISSGLEFTSLPELSPLDKIRQLDNGDGVFTEDIAKSLNKSVGEIYPIITQLASSGDIFSPKPDKWKVLE